MKTKMIFILMIFALFACKKKESDSSPGSTAPLLKTVSIGSSVVGKYWYDSQGRMTCQILVEGTAKDSILYSYGNNSVETLLYINNQFAQFEQGTLINGNVVQMRGYKPDSTSAWSAQYIYDANGFLITEIHMDNDTVETWRNEYQIQNNNIVGMNRINYAPLNITYEFYPGTINSLASVEKISTFYGKSSTNLVKKMTWASASGTLEENFSYEFYTNGWAKKAISITGSDTVTSYYTYW